MTWIALTLLFSSCLIQAADIQSVQAAARKLRAFKDSGLVINLSAPSNEVLAANAVLDELENALRDWLESQLSTAQDGALAATLNRQLPNSGLTANLHPEARAKRLIIPQCAELGCTLGQVGPIRISNPGARNFLVVRTVVGAWRAFDEPLYLYERQNQKWVRRPVPRGFKPTHMDELDSRQLPALPAWGRTAPNPRRCWTNSKATMITLMLTSRAMM